MCQEMLWLLELAVLNTDIQSEKIARQGLAYVYGIWLTVLHDMYLNNGKILSLITNVVGTVSSILKFNLCKNKWNFGC